MVFCQIENYLWRTLGYEGLKSSEVTKNIPMRPLDGIFSGR